MSIISDFLNNEKVQEMKNYIQHGRITTLDHCIRVSYTAYRWCKLLGLDYRSAARGALLHDFYLYDWHDKSNPVHSTHGFTHAALALKNAEKYFRLSSKEKDIIKKHMFPLNITPPRHTESFIACLADKYCALGETLRR